MAAPLWTLAPTSASRAATVPARWAVRGCSIFIASRTTTRSPASTCWPSDTATLTILPSMGATRASSPAGSALPGTEGEGRVGRRAGPGTAPSPAGRVTSRRRPPTSTTTRSRSAASSGVATSGCGSSRSPSSASIQPVCTANSSAKAGSRTTRRWNGSTVASPSTSNSSRARRLRSSAWRRSAPDTISLASSESKAPPTTLPCSTPASSRTPGPLGGRQRVTVPGVGRNPRPGSSPLIRNSTACPRTAGVAASSRSPAATRNISRTRSTPVTSSVTGCSTWSRVLTSRNVAVPSSPSRTSTVPAPAYPASAQMSRAARWSSARCRSSSAGAGASSTSFWCRR